MNTIPNISISPADTPNYPWEESLEGEGAEPKMSVAKNHGNSQRQQVAMHYVSDLREAIHNLPADQLISMVEEMDESEMN
jgi:hypothetical protein